MIIPPAISVDTKNRRWGIRQVTAFILLLGLSLLGNILAPRLFTGFNYIFGSLSALLVLRLFGIFPAIISAVVAALWCKVLFGHFYPVMWLGLEPVFVWFWMKKKPRSSMILADVLYWPILGLPIIFLCFFLFLKVSLLGTTTAGLMYWMVGITNAMLATIIFRYTPVEKIVWPDAIPVSIPLGKGLFHLLMAVILLPAIFVLVSTGRSRDRFFLHKMSDSLEQLATASAYEIRLNFFPDGIPDQLTASSFSAADREKIKKILLSLKPAEQHNITIIDRESGIIATTVNQLADRVFYNPLSAGSSIRKTSHTEIFQRMPPNSPPIPLWQRAGRSSFVCLYRIPSTAVTVVTETPFAPYQKEIFEGHRNALAVLLLYVAAVLSLTMLISKRITGSLQRLSSVTTDIPARLGREEELVWPPSRIAEVEQLTLNARTMAQELAARFREISESNRWLEKRVEERTEELTAANATLKAEIDERLRIEEELEDLTKELASKNKELEDVINAASHDLRSPLINIQGFSRKLYKHSGELESLIKASGIEEARLPEIQLVISDNIQKSLGFIIASAEKMEALLNGLLRLCRLGRDALTIEKIDMNSLLDKIIHSLAFQIESAGAEVEIGDLLPCRGDAVQVNQVFTNLIENALKFRDHSRPLRINISSLAFQDTVHYRIQDTGIGIPAEQQDSIWQMFHRLNPEETAGEGLGLAMSRRILDRLRGSIRVESEYGKGSRFFVMLPAIF